MFAAQRRVGVSALLPSGQTPVMAIKGSHSLCAVCSLQIPEETLSPPKNSLPKPPRLLSEPSFPRFSSGIAAQLRWDRFISAAPISHNLGAARELLRNLCVCGIRNSRQDLAPGHPLAVVPADGETSPERDSCWKTLPTSHFPPPFGCSKMTF